MNEADAAFERTKTLIKQALATRTTTLDLSKPETHALTEIPHEIALLSDLESLDLSYTNVTDLGPIASLRNLAWLDLFNTLVVDLSPLSSITTLRSLSLYGTKAVDVSPLGNLHGLVSLDLCDTYVSDLRPISELPVLSTLDLSHSNVFDLSPVLKLTGLLSPPPSTDFGEGPGITFSRTPACGNSDIAEIAEIGDPALRARTLFDYLADQVSPDPPSLPDQEKTGLRYQIGPDGVVRYAQLLDLADPSQQHRQLHALLVEDSGDLLATLKSSTNPTFAPIARKMERYAAALGSGLHSMSEVALWNAGNHLRLLLRADAEKKRQFVNEPTLDPGTVALLQGLVATHNAFSALLPDLAALDHAQIDPAERHKAEQDRALLQEAIDAFALQTKLILEEVTLDLRELHLEAAGDTDAALRAMKIEITSIDNLVKEILAQATIDARNDTFLSRISGDVRSAVVGGAVGSAMTGAAALSPQIAATFPQLVYALQPQIAELLIALHGQGSSMAQSAEWIVARLRQALKK